MLLEPSPPSGCSSIGDGSRASAEQPERPHLVALLLELGDGCAQLRGDIRVELEALDDRPVAAGRVTGNDETSPSGTP